MQSVALALGGALTLFLYFRAIESNWPFSYYSLTSLDVSYRASQSPVRYCLFRFGPVFVVSLFASVTATRLPSVTASPMAIAIVIPAIHGIPALIFPALSRAFGWNRSRSWALVTTYIVVYLITLLVGALAGFVRYRASPAVPTPDAVVATLWTGLIAGIAGVLVVSASRAKAADAHGALTVSWRQLNPLLKIHATRKAKEGGVDEFLVLAVMAVENLQRPPWFRRAERWKGKLFRRGTYGIMQVEAQSPISDEESIDRSITKFYGVELHNESGYPSPDAFRQFGHDYNGAKAYGDLLIEAYHLVGGGRRVDLVEPDGDQYVTKAEQDELYLSVGKAVVPILLEMFRGDDVDDSDDGDSSPASASPN